MRLRPVTPRPEITVREWEANGWTYELCQRASGTYVVYAVETDGDDWAIESGPTPKACLEAVHLTHAEIDALLTMTP